MEYSECWHNIEKILNKIWIFKNSEYTNIFKSRVNFFFRKYWHRIFKVLEQYKWKHWQGVFNIDTVYKCWWNFDFLKKIKKNHIGSHFIALILNNTVVWTGSKINLRLRRKIRLKFENWFMLYPPTHPNQELTHELISQSPPHELSSCRKNLWMQDWDRRQSLAEQ